MKKLIAKIFGLYTAKQCVLLANDAMLGAEEMKKSYYQKVIDELLKNGSLPPNCDLKMPKASMVIRKYIELKDADVARGEIIARDGKWLRLPDENEVVVIQYRKPKTTIPPHITGEKFDPYIACVGDKAALRATSEGTPISDKDIVSPMKKATVLKYADIMPRKERLNPFGRTRKQWEKIIGGIIKL